MAARYSLGVPEPIDTGFASVPQLRPSRFTARIAVPRQAASVPSVQAASLGTESPLQAPPVAQPQVPAPLPTAPPVAPAPVVAPPPVAPTLGTTDPSLNFEGSTFQTETPATTTSPAANEYRVDELLASLQSFSGLTIDAKWRELAKTNPQELIRQVEAIVNNAKQNGVVTTNGVNRADSSFRTRLDDWFSQFKGAMSETSSASNPDYEREKLRQQAFNQASERLTQELGYSGRDDEEQLISMLAERGLLNSGIASRELARFQGQRTQNYNDQMSKLNQMLTMGQLNFLDQKSLMLLQSALQFGNEKALLELRAKLERENQPDAWAQIVGTFFGGLGGLLGSGKKPSSLGTGDSGDYAIAPDPYVNT